MKVLQSVVVFVRKLRLRNPWNYKSPLLIALPYFMIAAGRIPAVPALLGIAASLATIVGIAGFAYFVNDLTDIEKDRLVGRENSAALLGWFQRFALLIMLLAAALLPWLYLPLRPATFALLAGELLLFVAYSCPPLRLKERGILGPLADAAYAHAVPALLAVLTFSYMAARPYRHLTSFLFALGGWQLALGFRNILLHQMKDCQDDLKSGTRTFVTKTPTERIERLLKFVAVPAEVLGFGLVSVLVSFEIPFFSMAYIAYLAVTSLKIKYVWKRPLPASIRDALYKYLDDYYIEWVPVLMLAYLAVQSPGFWLLAGLHLVLFRNGISQSLRELRNYAGI